MCNGNCGKCKKAEFETTDVQVESLGQRSGMIVDDIIIVKTDGDDSQELQPTCMRVPKSSKAIDDMASDINICIGYYSPRHKQIAKYLYEIGYRK